MDCSSIEEKLHKNEKLFSTLFNNTGVGIVLMDYEGKVVKANNKVCEMFGYSIDEAIGLHRREIYPSDKMENGWELYNRLVNKEIGSYEIEKIYKRKNGSIFWGLLTVSLFDNNDEKPSAIAVIQDIDSRKNAELAVERLNKELTELNDYKDKVISVIAHDLKSPFATCKQLLGHILETFEVISKDELALFLKLLETKFSDINELLEELILWAKNQLNKMPYLPQPIDVVKELNKVITSCRHQAVEKNITIAVQHQNEAVVTADVNMFYAIVRNLLTNAIKFSPEKSEIVVKTEQQGAELVISFIDTGDGMTKETIENIEAGRNRLTSYGTKGEKGLGLGLNLSKEFIEKNAGKLSIRSIEHSGSEISFTLPVAN